MRSFIRNKENPIWIVYALERTTKKVVGFSIGKRTKRTLQNVITTILLSNPKAVYTDGLRQCKSLIECNLHKVKCYGTNHMSDIIFRCGCI